MPQTSNNYDVLIVGGGVIGLSLAWELAQHDAKVCVVDRGLLGQEASWAGAGMIPPGPAKRCLENATALEQLESLSQTLQAEWHDKLLDFTGIDNEYQRCGSLQLALTDQDAEILHSKVERWKTLGIDCKPADSAQIADLEPALAANATQINSGYVLPDEAQIRNPRHIRALIAACESAGVELQAKSPVIGFETDGNSIVYTKTAGARYYADQVCIATGSWAGQLASNLGIELLVRPIRGQIALLKGPPGMLQRNINVGPRYLVSRRDGHLLIGSTQEDVGFEKATTEQDISDLRQLAASIAPPTAKLPLESSWSGLRPSTPNGAPQLGRLSNFENAWVATGHFRAGLQLSPATAVVMRMLLLGKQSPIDLATMSPAR